MRALAKTSPGPGLQLIDAPEPSAGPGQVKIRVERAGLCGTDLHLEGWDEWAEGAMNLPQIIGHEFFGEIVELGDGVEDRGDMAVGDKVSGEGHIVCGVCRNCRAGARHLCRNTLGVGVNRDGAFADYVVIPAENAWKQPDWVDADLGALFDPLGNAVHTALKFPLAAEDVLVTGSGPIGVMAVAVAQAVGARYVVATDVSDERLELARAAGADLTVNVSQTRIADAMAELGMKEGFDVCLEMSGHGSAVREAIDTMNHGGAIAMLGLPGQGYEVDWGKVITHMLTLQGIYGREMFETWYKMTQLLQDNETLVEHVRSVVTHRFAAEDWQEAFDTARSGKCGKVLLDWS
ncbi:L-threonine 3-dehydrogenase [Kytococcus sedentarius]|uniref:L-threonine 3-dehydrogenase n=1 Tax=Kytococcus sedentarius (strain ATCC 14392 / DSM 20547 / JCM 11482 / CCUG 33030 / NBRC 15357 / NCTC 11040 / CCM 314 / 541) TaxID=478801 RepID=C7NGF4_KYTSD|nr:L-threonine 3-dehydrogenase [Kytococcus sedentarius]ACV06062.1 L-threonine 3-dehydrogenase [Kytococcus sedentarius DSM 20547]QQB64430.1 L-threonine 3-dehydrogenase [Kytococcus sedentarius]STX12520.1 L-threonine 3-dehydrogenase [Kytococcus sedentarius]